MKTKRKNKGWSKRLEEKMLSELPQVMLSSMLHVESEAKRIVYLGHQEGHLNRQTGTLGRSITTEIHEGDTKYDLIVATGTNIVYAPTHEFGDDRAINGKFVHIPARPFLTPAYHSKKDEVKKRFGEGVKKIFDEVKK